MGGTSHDVEDVCAQKFPTSVENSKEYFRQQLICHALTKKEASESKAFEILSVGWLICHPFMWRNDLPKNPGNSILAF